MKTTIRLLGIIAAAAIIGFGVTACDDGSSPSSGGGAALDYIEITTGPIKTEYDLGEALVTTGLVITAHYNDGEVKIVTGGYTTSGFDSTTPGEKTVTVTYGGKSDTFMVTVIGVVYTSIEIASEPNKTEYRRGEPLDLTGIVVIAYKDDSTFIYVDIENLQASGFNSSTAGTKTVTVSFGGHSDSFDVEISSVTLSSIAITTPPKTAYFVGEVFDPTGMVVTATFSDSETETVAYSILIIEGFNSATTGSRNVTVRYGTAQTMFTITVTAVSLDHITILTPPAKLIYNIGEPLDITGMVVKAHYNNGSSETASGITVANITGYNANTQGSQQLTVTYQSKPATFDVLVIDTSQPLSNLEITTPPSKTTYYQGEELDLTGMVAKGTWGTGGGSSSPW